MRPERELIITKAISDFWQLDKGSQVVHDLSLLKNVVRSGWKFVGFLPGFQEYPPAVLKVYFRGDGFDHEMKGISAVNSFQAIDNIRTPTVLKIIPEYKAIFTEFLQLRDSRTDFRKLSLNKHAINWHDLGKWLRNFHDYETTYQQNRTFIEQKIEKSYEQVEKFTSLFSAKQATRIKSLIGKAYNDLENHKQEWVFSHGDFHTGNLKISGDSTYVIDFENSTMTPREYEINYFLSCIESTIHFIFRKRKFSCLAKEFLGGYDMQFSNKVLNDYFYLIGKLDTIAYYSKQENSTNMHTYKLSYAYLVKKVAKSLHCWLLQS